MNNGNVTASLLSIRRRCEPKMPCLWSLAALSQQKAGSWRGSSSRTISTPCQIAMREVSCCLAWCRSVPCSHLRFQLLHSQHRCIHFVVFFSKQDEKKSRFNDLITMQTFRFHYNENVRSVSVMDFKCREENSWLYLRFLSNLFY